MRVLLAVDGSAHADVAVRNVKSRPWPSGSAARVVCVAKPILPLFPFPPSFAGGAAATAVAAPMVGRDPMAYPELREQIRSDSEALVQRIAQELRGESDLQTDSVVREGDPRQVIVEEAESWQADLIVLGSRGLSTLQRWLLGSVAESVLRHAPCSVEIARESAASR